jgi:hypothetical protein
LWSGDNNGSVSLLQFQVLSDRNVFI